MNVGNETKQNLIHLHDFCASGVCIPSRCTQTRDTGFWIDLYVKYFFNWVAIFVQFFQGIKPKASNK